MAKTGGLGDNLYIDGVDLSGDISALSRIGGSVAALDFTGINKFAFERKGGIRDGSIEFTSFFNPTADETHDVLSSLPTTNRIVSYYRGTTAGGWAANLVAKQANYDPTRGADGALTLAVQAQGNGYGLEWARQLTAGKRTDTAPADGAGLALSPAQDPFVLLPGETGAYVSTPDAAALDITGDIDIRAKVALDDWTPSVQQTLVAKWSSGSGDNRSYALAVTTTGLLTLGWSTDGTSTSLSKNSSVATGFTDGSVHWVRATLDVDDGAGGASVRFYTSGDGATWTQLGTTQAVGATTSIFAGTAPVELGSQFAGVSNVTTGRVYAAEIRDGIDGTVVAAPVVAVGGVEDATGLTWTVNGTASIASGSGFGLQAYLHVFAFTGTSATIKLQHSADDAAADAYSDITGGAFTQVTAAPTSERIQTARDLAVDRYLRVVTTGTFTELVFAVSVAVNKTEVTF